MMEQILTCNALTKNFSTKNALNNIGFEVRRSQIIGLLGPNGSGKTTLIKLLCGLLTPDGGEILINGNHPGVETKKVVSYLPDKDFLPPGETVAGMVSYYEDFYDNFRRGRAEEMLKSLEIDPSAKLKTLSKGNREKVALILVMSRDADLYLLDEPIAGVDPAARDYIISTIIRNFNDNAAIIISTHLISDVETILSDVMFLKDGQIVLNGNADEIRENEGKGIDTLFRETFSQL